MTTHHGLHRSLLALTLAALFAGCGGDGGRQDGAPAAAETAAPVQVADPATLTGTITFTGSPPAGTPIDMGAEPDCAARHPDGVTTQEVVVRDGRLANVFVYIRDGISGTYPAPATAVVIDQVGCVYTPHVSGVQVGQTVTFRNSDGLLHNIRAQPTVNRPFNISQPTNMDTPRTFQAREVMIPLECNVHNWMRAYIGVMDHPYFAVSSADGTFRIPNLPAGTYTVEVWHERYGTQTQQVSLAANETLDIGFEYSAGMAGRPVPLGPPLDPHGSHDGHRGHAAAHTGADH
jgi:plastocyanin